MARGSRTTGRTRNAPRNTMCGGEDASPLFTPQPYYRSATNFQRLYPMVVCTTNVIVAGSIPFVKDIRPIHRCKFRPAGVTVSASLLSPTQHEVPRGSFPSRG